MKHFARTLLGRLAIVLLVPFACGSPSDGPGASAPPPAPAPPTETAPVTPPAAIPEPTTQALGDPFAALRALPPACTPDGWCWQSPAPIGNDYSRVYATAPDNIWLIGQHGTVMQWDGQRWAFHHPPVLPGEEPAQYPFSITGRGPNDMWLIYGTTIVRWDGKAWSLLGSLPRTGNPAFNVIWESPDGDAWVTRSDGLLQRSKAGGAFQTIHTAPGFLGSIWGTAEDDVFITTLPPGIIHYDGKSFTRVYDGPLIVGSYQGTRNDVWVSGGSGAGSEMLHWDGATFTAVGTKLPADWYVTAIAARASDDVSWWANRASVSSAFLHWNGKTLTATMVDTSNVGGFLYAGAVIDDKWWLVGAGGSVYTRTGDAIAPVVANAASVLDMWGSSDEDMYFASGGTIRHFDGVTTTPIAIAAGHLSGVRAGGVDEIFATGNDRSADGSKYVASAYHFDGTNWTKVPLESTTIPSPPGETFRSFLKVFAMGPGEAMAVGTHGIAYHFTNGGWTAVATGTTAELQSVWGPDADHLWFSGPHGVLLSWNRATPDVATPDPVFSAADDDLGPIHGAGGVTWVGVTNGAHVWKNAGAGWVSVPTTAVASGLFAVSATNVVISSAGQSRLARWNGNAFLPEDSGSGLAAPVLFQPPGGSMLAGGQGAGQLLVHR